MHGQAPVATIESHGRSLLNLTRLPVEAGVHGARLTLTRLLASLLARGRIGA